MSDGIIPVYPPVSNNGFDAFTETVTLSGAQYILTWTWMSRMRSWYIDIAAVDGTPLVQGMRVTPGWAPWAALRNPGLPSGLYFVTGPDPYDENALGSTVLPVYSTDRPTVPSNPYGLRVVLS